MPTHEKEVDANGNYCDTRIHEISRVKWRNVLPKGRKKEAGVKLSARVQGLEGIQYFDINQIDNPGCGIAVFRCPVESCHETYSVRWCVERHWSKHFEDIPIPEGQHYYDHITMSSYPRQGKRSNYARVGMSTASPIVNAFQPADPQQIGVASDSEEDENFSDNDAVDSRLINVISSDTTLTSQQPAKMSSKKKKKSGKAPKRGVILQPARVTKSTKSKTRSATGRANKVKPEPQSPLSTESHGSPRQNNNTFIQGNANLDELRVILDGLDQSVTNNLAAGSPSSFDTTGTGKSNYVRMNDLRVLFQRNYDPHCLFPPSPYTNMEEVHKDLLQAINNYTYKLANPGFKGNAPNINCFPELCDNACNIDMGFGTDVNSMSAQAEYYGMPSLPSTVGTYEQTNVSFPLATPFDGVAGFDMSSPYAIDIETLAWHPGDFVKSAVILREVNLTQSALQYGAFPQLPASVRRGVNWMRNQAFFPYTVAICHVDVDRNLCRTVIEETCCGLINWCTANAPWYIQDPAGSWWTCEANGLLFYHGYDNLPAVVNHGMGFDKPPYTNYA